MTRSAHRIGGGGGGGGGSVREGALSHLLLIIILLAFIQWKISKLAVITTGTKGIIVSHYGEGEAEEGRYQEYAHETMKLPCLFLLCVLLLPSFL